MTTKQILHQLIDKLPDDALLAAQRLLESLRSGDDPLLRAFMEAPEDDEPETEEEWKAVKEAKSEIARGEGIPWEVARRRLLGEG